MKMGLFGILGVVFVTLKLTENIDWSWWYVLMPFYILPFILVAFFVIFWLCAIASFITVLAIEKFKK